ncbi:MAG TPA: pyruvate formate lyase family protein [Armatimonadota bacterium]|nr:pyruvate formate lyase family protein [Armatimonadota bacterium]
MSVTTKTTADCDLWGTFDTVRDRLYNQFIDARFDPSTGIGLDELEREADESLASRGDAPRVLQKAHLLRIVATRGQISIDPADWFVDKLNHGRLIVRARERWHEEACQGPIAQEAAWSRRMHEIGAIRGGLDHGHISPGWENMFAGGLTSLMGQATESRERLGASASPDQLAFYEAVEIACGAAIHLSERFAALAAQMATECPEHSLRLQAVSETCSRVPAHSPRTLHEALQFAWFMHELIEMEGEMVRSMGHFDRVIYPYYRADIDAGRLTQCQAKELIKFFWIKHHARTRGSSNGKNFVFGGQDADGRAIANDLTYLALEAYEELNAPDPKLSVRFTPDTPDALYARVADLIRGGTNSCVLMNDEAAVAALVERGKTLKDARSYLPIGCYEPAVDGKEAACTMNLVVNLAKPIELALNSGTDPLSGETVGPRTGDAESIADFEAFFEAYGAQLDHLITISAEAVNAHEREWPRINPSPLIAATIDDCLSVGRDIGEGGARYNAVGCVGTGLANACDALLAIKQIVFDEERLTLAQLRDVLASNWEGNESLRLHALNRVAKWGTNDATSDAIGKRVAEHYCDKVHAFRSARGGPFQAALFSLEFQWEFGRQTGALPDGRRDRETLAPGVGSQPGLDKRGVTALMNSVTELDFTKTPNGAVLDVMLHPTAVRGDDGLQALVTLIKTFFARGGYAVQFNVIDSETLREAQRVPEQYASVQIRLTGWSVYFVTVPKHQQDQFIGRISHQA